MIEEQEDEKKWLYYYKALAYEKQGDLDEVIHFLNKSIDVDPNFVLAWGSLGMAYELTNNQQKKEESFNRIIKISNESLSINPNDVHTWYHKALANFELKNYPKAVESLKNALELNPTYELALKLMGELCIKLKQFEKSLEYYEKLDPNELDSKTWYHMGSACRELKKYQSAFGCFEESVQLDPVATDAWIDLAEIYLKLNKKEDASRCFHGIIDSCDHWIESNPNNFLTWHQMGWAYKHLAEYSRAIKCFKKAIEIEPKFPWPWEEMGDIYVFLDKPQNSAVCYDKAIELDPNNDKTVFIAGNLHYWLRNYEKAIEYLEKLVQIHAEDATLWRNLGMSHYHLKNYQKAVNF